MFMYVCMYIYMVVFMAVIVYGSMWHTLKGSMSLKEIHVILKESMSIPLKL